MFISLFTVSSFQPGRLVVDSVDRSQSFPLGQHHRPLVRLVVGLGSDNGTDRHEQTEGGNRPHDVLAQCSHNSIGTGAMLQNRESTKQNADTDTDRAAHDGAHLEFVKVGRLVVLNRHGANRTLDRFSESRWAPSTIFRVVSLPESLLRVGIKKTSGGQSGYSLVVFVKALNSLPPASLFFLAIPNLVNW